MPLKRLVVLTGVVVLAHLLALENTPLQFSSASSMGARAFTTRTLQIAATAVSEAPVAPPPAARTRAVAIAPPTATPAPAAPEPAIVPPRAPEVVRDAVPVAEVPAPEPAASAALATAQPQPLPPGLAAPLDKDPAAVPRNYAVPGSVRLKFNAIGQRTNLQYSALGEMLWLHDGKDYEARMELSVLFTKRTLTSTGRLTGDGLAPGRFSDRFRSEQAAHFDRDKARVVFSANTPEAPLLPGAQDQLSVFVQLAAMLAGDPQKFPIGTSIAVQTIGPRAAEPWVFVMDIDETLNLPGGQQATRKLVRTPRKDFDQKVELWMAPGLAWLPARIRITQPNGDFIDQQWRSTGSP